MTLTLFPYWQGGEHGCWVFDDQRTGLQAEAFVRGTTEMISRVVEAKAIGHAKAGFAMTFASAPFDGYDVEVTRLTEGEAERRGRRRLLVTHTWEEKRNSGAARNQKTSERPPRLDLPGVAKVGNLLKPEGFTRGRQSDSATSFTCLR